ncbi:hypothetical protein AWB93_10990 [Mycobacterium bohemicum]|uniref:Uncharacterized protein n=1 Tax=Mycobacterium bohemicum TaxID=56425 RepID=A0A1X1R4X2_MYCBE|nr:hypothetical protein AWB93_10990 [Mycobacterium bohemicum]
MIEGTAMFVANCLCRTDVAAVAGIVLTSVLAPEFVLKALVPTTSPACTIRQTRCDSVSQRHWVTRESNHD